MGDGSVVVILDPHAMVRQELVRLEGDRHDDAQALLARQQAAVPTILVVDDSVTVRKVTTRFLEREGYIVHTAKDGVDALAQLQELRPDLMLLDIEMPRMDGFEVAKNVRSSARLKDLPIIMITSRTGDKHRDHAFSLGVNKYMGKPYQEDALIGGIQELLDNKTE
jgi:chemosensory pili system protein ChpA (sensor histidine kinase/response regulator)